MKAATANRRGVPDAAPAALYQQVKEYIARHIQSRAWQPGDRVPSEQELVTRFGVSRMTVNRALRELAEQGRVVRVAGVGTFVAEHKPQSTLLNVVNLQDEIRMRGHDYACDVIVVERVAASIEVAAALDLHTGESVFHSVCVHREDGVPVQLEDRYVNPRAAPDFINQDFAAADGMKPGEYLLRHVPYDQIEHVVDAISATPEQATRLEMPAGQPCLLLTRRTWTSGTPVTFVRCLHPGNRYRLGSRFRADGNPAFG
ncbi:histidine utilization repressor [Cupriavidus basilensis]|uniref:Histidine utilization repressor n=1 Tax=Cupriavidus basilensis TaxID=68895 RepID=A0ABT6AWN5_9BURK|nr:histidine utilization repressor [Cupriavidus basilensis]MDF3836773.1 histidine utilization repressor [Cupriavidus basilensis]